MGGSIFKTCPDPRVPRAVLPHGDGEEGEGRARRLGGGFAEA
jgi:hypothetical protein